MGAGIRCREGKYIPRCSTEKVTSVRFVKGCGIVGLTMIDLVADQQGPLMK